MQRKIYFAAAIRGSREDIEVYQQIIAILKKYGTVLTEHIGDVAVGAEGDPNLTKQEIRDRDLAWLAEATHCVAEITQASLGVGYELALVEQREMPFVGFHRQIPSKVSAMLCGHFFDGKLKYYDLHNFDILEKDLDKFFADA